MKGGLAVLLDLAATIAARRAVDVTYVFYPCEEVARRHNGLGPPGRDAPRAPRRRRRRAGRAHRRAWSRPGARGRCGRWCAGRPAGPHGAAVDGRERRAPAWPGPRRPASATSRAGSSSTAASTPNSSRRSASKGAWPATSCPTGRDHRQLPLRPRPQHGRRRRADAARLSRRRTSTAAAGDRIEVDGRRRRRPRLRSTIPCWPRLVRPQRRTRRGPRWAGPTWPRSPAAGSRPPTSAPATRSWPTPPTSTCRAAELDRMYGRLLGALAGRLNVRCRGAPARRAGRWTRLTGGAGR